MKIKYIFWLILWLLLSTQYIYAQYESCTEQFFKLTAYYSPISWQDYYIHDSYAEDIKLNGKWTHGASGKWVFDGMIAAPSKYSFGTYIVLPWLGIWEVADRWWAIIAWSGWDRIDIRAGKWTLWIHRAYGMWPVNMTWYICTWDIYSDQLWFKRPNYDKDYDDVIFWTLNQSIWRQDIMVNKLQYILNKYWYLTSDFENGVFDEKTRIWVCNYQIKKWIFDKIDEECGIRWPKTRTLFKTDLFDTNIKLETKPNNTKSNVKTSTTTTKSPSTIKLSNTTAKDTTTTAKTTQKTSKKTLINFFTSPIDLWVVSKKISSLQNILSFQWIKIQKTWKMDAQTKNAIYQLQLKYKLIKSTDDKNLRWYMWPSTRALLNQLYTDLQ